MWVIGDLAFLIGDGDRHRGLDAARGAAHGRLDERLAAERAARGEEPWTPRVPRGQTGR